MWKQSQMKLTTSRLWGVYLRACANANPTRQPHNSVAQLHGATTGWWSTHTYLQRYRCAQRLSTRPVRPSQSAQTAAVPLYCSHCTVRASKARLREYAWNDRHKWFASKQLEEIERVKQAWQPPARQEDKQQS